MNPSSSSSLVPFSCKRPKNDVFLNYSVEDTGNHFVGHFKAALKRNFFTISDDHSTLPKGKDESSELLKAIEDSQICFLVFSTKYPISMKSLDELVLIMDSLSKFKNRIVFPLFMNVDPSDVRNLRGCFEEAFRTHEANVDPERVHNWKKALEATGGISGLHLENRNEADFIELIVKELKKIKIPEKLFYVEHPVGIEPRAQAIISKLRLGSNIVVVFGIGGSGKSTIVKAVFDIIVADFDCNCFIENIQFYNNKGRKWMDKLQRKVLLRLTGNDPSGHDGKSGIIKVISTRKALLVLDDVENYEELEALGVPFYYFDSGSRIIVTTRNKSFLSDLPPHTLYEISLLNYEEAFELFVGFAYRKDEPNDENFVKEIVYLAGGLPLVLENWGRNFKAHDRRMWPNLLKGLRGIPDKNIQKKLQMSYDSLCKRSKKLFLDIACFFDGWETSVIFKVLEDQKSSFFPEIELQVLVDRGLVEIEYRKVVLHEVIREMGKEVVRQENEDEPGQRTRLIDPLDVLHVLENNSGTDSVRSIMLDASGLEEQSLQVDALKKMINLRFIKLLAPMDHSFTFSNDDTSLSFKQLKYLEWHCFPQRRFNIDMSNVVVIKLSDSKLETLEGFKNLKNLRFLDVSCSKSLSRTGNFVGLENLEKLDLTYCFNLKEVDSSIVCLEKLRFMLLHSCKNIYSIPNLPPNIEYIDGNNCERLACLPSNMYELQSLTYFCLNGCKNIYSIPNLPPNIEYIDGNNCERLACLPSNMYELQSLTYFCLNGCKNIYSIPNLPPNTEEIPVYNCESLACLPSNMYELQSLTSLNLKGCKNIYSIPNLPPNIEKIHCGNCESLECLPSNMYELQSLTYLYLNGCKNIYSIPNLPPNIETFWGNFCERLVCLPSNMYELQSLAFLSLNGCKNIYSIPNLPPNIEKIDCGNCESLECLPSNMYELQSLTKLSLICCKNIYSIPNLPPNIKKFHVYNCENLAWVPSNMDELQSLTSLSLNGCKNLYSIPNLPPNIEKIHCGNCESLECLPSNMYELQSLWYLCLKGCKNIYSIPNLPPNIEKIHCGNCESLECLPSNMYELQSLWYLCLKGCKNIYSIPNLPPNIEFFCVRNCESLMCLPSNMYELQSLSSLSLDGCKNIYSIPNLPPNIEEIPVYNCESLACLPSNMYELQSLTSLNLKGCKNIYSIPNLPPNIEKIDCGNCESLECLPSNMYELQSLTYLYLNGCKNIYSIPNLPPNIEHFHVNNCESLACLPSNMYELQSLTLLKLDGCVTLGSENFVKVTGLRNLRVLSMENCNVSQVSTEIGNLVSLQELNLSRNGFSTLPDSFSNLSELIELEINDCPELYYLPLLPANLKTIKANGCSSLNVMPFDTEQMANIFRSKMFKESLFTRKLCITLSRMKIPAWCSTTNKEIGNVFSFVAPMHLDKKICGAIILLGTTTYNHKARMLNKTKETGHRLDISFTYQPASFIFYPLNDATLMVEAGDSLEIQFEKGDPLSCGLTFIYEGDVKDSELVIQNRNLTHEHTFRVPSEMNATASITQLTDHFSEMCLL